MIIRDKKHLSMVRMLPCVAGGKGNVQACHIRKFTDGGMGMKPSDCYVLPLSFEKHQEQHRAGELTFWGGIEGIYKAIDWAKELYAVTGDIFAAQRVTMKARKDLI